jgi:hypothetical protein
METANTIDYSNFRQRAIFKKHDTFYEIAEKQNNRFASSFYNKILRFVDKHPDFFDANTVVEIRLSKDAENHDTIKQFVKKIEQLAISNKQIVINLFIISN